MGEQTGRAKWNARSTWSKAWTRHGIWRQDWRFQLQANLWRLRRIRSLFSWQGLTSTDLSFFLFFHSILSIMHAHGFACNNNGALRLCPSKAENAEKVPTDSLKFRVSQDRQRTGVLTPLAWLLPQGLLLRQRWKTTVAFSCLKFDRLADIRAVDLMILWWNNGDKEACKWLALSWDIRTRVFLKEHFDAPAKKFMYRIVLRNFTSYCSWKITSGKSYILRKSIIV